MEVKMNVRKGTEIDMKRFYLRGVSFTCQCPTCKSSSHFDGDQGDYVSYPKVGEKENVQVLCLKCDDWFDVPIKIEVEVTINPEK